MSSFDETYYKSVADGSRRLVESGLDPLEAMKVAAETAGDVLEASGDRVARTLVKRSPRMLRQRRRVHKRFARRLRRHWGKALDLVYVVIVCAEEAGSDYQSERAGVPEGEQLREALAGMHARACRTALEVHHLLSDGLGMGALARCRTLHELAVTAMILGEYGERPEHADLAEKFVLHEQVVSLKDAVIYQEHWQTLGVQPLSHREMAELVAASDSLCDRFGKYYKRDYGWASGIEGILDPSFRDLERLASVSHLRGYYRWASHEVHADAKGLALNTLVRNGEPYRLTGYTNVGLADPGQMAIISLHQSVVALLLSEDNPSPRNLLALKAMGRLVEDACQALVEGEAAVERAEERYQS